MRAAITLWGRKKLKNKIETIFVIACFIAIGIIVASVIRDSRQEPTPREIWDKCENNGRYFVEVWVEVTPEEYIGLDIGDEYEVK